MYYNRLFTFIILFLCTFSTKAAVFTVTSNADTGPGTLREALTLAAANGSAEKDFIYFNLPDLSEAGRTITLTTQLPFLSSNLSIDASTQPGSKIGVSDARVILQEKQITGTLFNGFYGRNVTNIEIYSLYFNHFFEFDSSYAINIWDSSNIVIGSPGKGNAFGFLDTGLFILRVNNVKVASNIFGVDLATLQPAYTTYSCNLRIYASNPVIIGGDTQAEGNIFVFGAYDRPSVVTGFDANTGGTIPIDNCVIKNNTFGFKTGANNFPGPYTFKAIKNLVIDNNIYNYGATSQISDVSGMLLIRGNKTNLDAALLPDPQSTSGTPFYLYQVSNAVIGGPAAGDANIINNLSYGGYSFPAVYTNYCNKIRLQRNSFSCKTTTESYTVNTPDVPLPVISITNIDNGILTGTATPGAEVEIFSDSQCQLCEPAQYLASVTADANGSWQYATANQAIGYTASATIDGRTSLFVKVAYDESSLVITNPSCGKSSGSITGLKLANSTRIEWKNAAGTVVGTKLNVSDLPPGNYTFTAYLSDKCSVTSNAYVLVDVTPVINDANISVLPNSCRGSDGSVTGLYIENSNVVNIQSTIWRNKDMAIVGRDLYLKDVPGGAYTLTVTTTSGCEVTYGPVNLANTAAPVIVESSYTTTPSNCNSPTGAINGIYATGGTGTLKYSWRNAQGQEVSTSPNPTNQYAGKYRLRVTDDSDCGEVYSTEIEILENNGITLITSGATGKSARCGKSDGEVTGLEAPGADAFLWQNTATNAVVGNKINLTGVPAGNYKLTMTNATCTKFAEFTVLDAPATVFPDFSSTITKSCLNYGTGTITLNTGTNPDEQPAYYRWLDELGQPAGGDKTAQFLRAGKYKLFLIDKNGCLSFYKDYTVEAYPELAFKTYGTITHVKCGVGTGAVSETVFVGGTGNYKYQWLDKDKNPIIGKTEALIDNVPPGDYTLTVDDGCGAGEITYTIRDEAATPPAPSADNVRVYNAGKAIIKINNPFPTAIYRLYETATSAQPIKDTIGGNISINVTESRSYYVSLTYGYCESDRTEVKVFLSALTGDIVNTFTPNGDGINDYWTIKGLDTYPDATVKIFNRYGSSVFESVGYTKPFDGTRNSKPLPAGVYYYIINLKRGDVLSGSVTIIR